MEAYPTAKNYYLKTLGIRQIVSTKIGKFKGTLPEKIRQIILHVRQIGFHQIVFRQIVPNPHIGSHLDFANAAVVSSISVMYIEKTMNKKLKQMKYTIIDNLIGTGIPST